MKNKLIITTAVIALMTLPMNVFAVDTSIVSNENSSTPVQTASEISSRMVVHKDKTVVKYYTSTSDVPEYISYSEYADGVNWSGVLYLQSIVKSGVGWNATFKGSLGGSI